jgi:uncharacterized membrane protein YadS
VVVVIVVVLVPVVVVVAVLANIQSQECNSNKKKLNQHIRYWVNIMAAAIIAATTATMHAQPSK